MTCHGVQVEAGQPDQELEASAELAHDDHVGQVCDAPSCQPTVVGEGHGRDGDRCRQLTQLTVERVEDALAGEDPVQHGSILLTMALCAGEVD